MTRIEMYKNHGIRTCCPCYQEHEQHTREGLAYTPSQMYEMTAKGLPVNNLNNQKVYFDGTSDASFHVGDERQRGVDVATLWENQQILREKARKAARAAKQNNS